MVSKHPTDEDVESAITSLERRLRSLQADLDGDREAPPSRGEARVTQPRVETARRSGERWAPTPTPTPTPRPARRQADAPARTPPPRSSSASPSRSPSPSSDHVVAALERFGTELRRLTGELADAWDRTVEEIKGSSHDEHLFSGDVALEVEARLGTLAAIDAALTAIPQVRSVELRSYAGRRAILDVTLDGELALVRELRDTLGHPFAVTAAGDGLLTIELRAS
jgi:hypothetical protein